MMRPNYTSVRQTALSIATAVAISVPEICKDDPLGRTRTVPGEPGEFVAGVMKELNLKKQIQNSFIMMQHLQSDEQYSSCSPNDGAESVNFRVKLKGVISDFLSLICIVPALNADYTLIDNLESALTLVDSIPSRTLFLLWKTLGDQLEHIRTVVNRFGQNFAVIPPLESFTVFNEATYTYETNDTNYFNNQTSEKFHHNGAFDQSMFNRSFVDLLQARLEMYACRLNSFADLVPENRMNRENANTSYACAALNSSNQTRFPLELVAMTH